MDDQPADETALTFHVKSSSDAKYTLTLPASATVLELKEKLATPAYADLPPDRQRLIYSGRVLKDPDTLGSYKIKEGHTVHLVKSASSNQQQQPQSSGSGSAAVPSAVPTNLSAGTGNNPLAGLTGGRYAGFAQLPSQDMFGPDGGMGPPPDPEDMIRMLQNPQFASTLNEALSNPQVLDMMIQQNPLLRGMGPQFRQMMLTPEFRRMMTDPEHLRSVMQMQRMFGGAGPGGMMGLGGRGGQAAFPAPGATDTTPEGQPAATAPGSGSQQQQPQAQQPAFNPMAFFGAQGGGAGAAGGGQGAAAANPFAALFNNPTAFGGAAPAPSNPGADGSNSRPSSVPPAANAQAPPPQPSFNPSAQAAPPPLAPGQQNPFNNLDDAGVLGLANMIAGQQGPDGQGPPPEVQRNVINAVTRMIANRYGDPGFAAEGGAYPPHMPPADLRPPEERYADQLRQLNDMGFYEFERNVAALRRAGGSVQGAIEYLLSHP